MLTSFRAHFWRSTAVAASAVLLVAAPAAAMDLSEWVPGLKFSPFVSERLEYESNVFLAPSHARDDLISRTIPGFLADYGNGPLSLSAGYRAEVLRFLDMTKQDALHHIGVAQIRYETPRLLTVLRDDFTKTTDPPGTELTGRIESTTNVLAPQLEYRITERLALGTDYTWTRVRFQTTTVQRLDRDEHLIGGSAFWKILPKADLRVSYLWGEKNFPNDSQRDVTRNIGLVGVRGDLTPKLSSTLRVGFESREPDRPRLKAYHGLVAGGDVIYRLTERTKLSLLVDRSPQESIFANQLFFLSTTGALILEQRFSPKLAALLRVNGGDNAYPTKATLNGQTKFRDDTLFGAGAGIDYDIQPWLRVGAEYSRNERRSNFRTFNFVDDKVTGKVTLQF